MFRDQRLDEQRALVRIEAGARIAATSRDATSSGGAATGAPSASVGADGDVYIDTLARMFYGPKAGGAWPSGINLAGSTGPAGPAGPAGTSGGSGATGATGATGAAGNSVLNGSGAPSGGTGSNGDFYIDTTANRLYGPKAAGAWPGSYTSLVGPTGSTGTAGNTVLNGSGAPSSGTGSNGDFYIDTTANRLYGPKAAGAWPGSYTSLVGPTGATGAAGVLNYEVQNQTSSPTTLTSSGQTITANCTGSGTKKVLGGGWSTNDTTAGHQPAVNADLSAGDVGGFVGRERRGHMA